MIIAIIIGALAYFFLFVVFVLDLKRNPARNDRDF